MPVFAYDGKMKKSLKIDHFFCVWVLKNEGVYDIICKKYRSIPLRARARGKRGKEDEYE